MKDVLSWVGMILAFVTFVTGNVVLLAWSQALNRSHHHIEAVATGAGAGSCIAAVAILGFIYLCSKP